MRWGILQGLWKACSCPAGDCVVPSVGFLHSHWFSAPAGESQNDLGRRKENIQNVSQAQDVTEAENAVVRQWKEDCTQEGLQVFGGVSLRKKQLWGPLFWHQLRNLL